MNIKQTLPVLSLLLCSSLAGLAQCEQNVVLTSSKTEYLDASMTAQRTVDEKTVIEISDSSITITPGNEPNKMAGPILSKSCNWTVPYKAGKSLIKAKIEDPSGDTKNITLTIEGKDGKVILLAEIEDRPDQKIRVTADTFEAKK
jgi:hypothetical protein